MKSFVSIVAFSAAMAGFAAAKPAVETRTSCKSNQFWYAKLGCCLDHGGPSTPPTPPRSRDCPSNGWYWNSKQGCCTPRHEEPPEPSCKGGYSWSKGSWCCEEESTPPPSPQPSQTPGKGGYNGGNNGGYNGGNNGGYNGGNNGGYNGGNGGYHGGWKKRHNRIPELCPAGLKACSVSGASGYNKSSDYECIDPLADLRSCGGCASEGEGQDCTAIAHSLYAGCVSGGCEVYTCSTGYKVSSDSKSCIKI
ncbi:putative effector protein/Choline transport protein [Ceratobasidium theobromae]|uniref:Putative effector protein/Choline transport protein n=1 Tax=Ceratobasidium theobromae TaxID=1582974 RepID=A0A5N5QLJ4_9AGAM|nr:putative effector protein/Choline transport protein [Ceratobasidium theobromae]